ncbi:hypothetical protein BSKO_10162 [Bryopsis sp. KO-2023]|nr:hypothetical protein BSKO_10162 [Bryopsis sp. KO-2023]
MRSSTAVALVAIGGGGIALAGLLYLRHRGLAKNRKRATKKCDSCGVMPSRETANGGVLDTAVATMAAIVTDTQQDVDHSSRHWSTRGDESSISANEATTSTASNMAVLSSGDTVPESLPKRIPPRTVAMCVSKHGVAPILSTKHRPPCPVAVTTNNDSVLGRCIAFCGQIGLQEKLRTAGNVQYTLVEIAANGTTDGAILRKAVVKHLLTQENGNDEGGKYVSIVEHGGPRYGFDLARFENAVGSMATAQLVAKYSRGWVDPTMHDQAIDIVSKQIVQTHDGRWEHPLFEIFSEHGNLSSKGLLVQDKGGVDSKTDGKTQYKLELGTLESLSRRFPVLLLIEEYGKLVQQISPHLRFPTKLLFLVEECLDEDGVNRVEKVVISTDHELKLETLVSHIPVFEETASRHGAVRAKSQKNPTVLALNTTRDGNWPSGQKKKSCGSAAKVGDLKDAVNASKSLKKKKRKEEKVCSLKTTKFKSRGALCSPSWTCLSETKGPKIRTAMLEDHGHNFLPPQVADLQSEKRAAPEKEKILSKPASAASPQSKQMSMIEYMDSTVTQVLKDALKALNESRPGDPIQFLYDFLMDSKKS